ncbi:MAG TPA: hypothetical protein VK191_02330 [Symbiobacteriaceae bacterium]|nr:hypothetical protein [Symbiobacteriaceae bacterium]
MKELIKSLAKEFDEAGIPFSFDAGTALFLQGVEYDGMDDIDISVPWALLQRVHQLLDGPTPIDDRGGWAKFRFEREGIPVDILSYKGTDLATDPDRVALQLGARTVYAKSLAFFQRNLPPDDPRRPAIAERLANRH